MVLALVGVAGWHARRITNKHTGCAVPGGLVGVSALILRKREGHNKIMQTGSSDNSFHSTIMHCVLSVVALASHC